MFDAAFATLYPGRGRKNLLRMAAGRGLSAIERTECEGHYVVTVLSGEPWLLP